MSADFSDATLLGTVQGLTEFLPVSSSGHLALGQLWLGLSEGNLTLSVMLHAGTLLATLWFFRERIARIVTDIVAAPSRSLTTEGGQDALTVVVASVPTAIIGLLFKDTFEAWTLNPKVVGVGFLVTALVLLSTRFTHEKRGSSQGRFPADQFPTPLVALLVGCAQAIAIAPGISRSGSTIAALLWLGVQPRRAFELSMLISLPAVTGAFLLEARHLGETPGSMAPILWGAAVSFGVGLLALKLLQGVVNQGRFAWFVLWVAPLAAVALLGS